MTAQSNLADVDDAPSAFEADFGADDDFVFPSTGLTETAEIETFAPEPSPPPALESPVGVNPVGALIAATEAALGEASVPRITIHAFCQNSETATLAEQMSQDRRLSRATTLVRLGSLDDALELYQSQSTPSLVIVESADPAPILLAGLDRLAEVCDPGTKVMVIGAHNDIALYRELMRRGVSEYIVPPLQVLQLIRTVTNLYVDPATPFVGSAAPCCSTA